MKELKLSDAFEEKSNPINLELKVTLINIRAENNGDILQSCTVLNQYSRFVQAYEANKGSLDRMGDTIKYCVEHDILKEYILLHPARNWSNRAERERGAEHADDGLGL